MNDQTKTFQNDHLNVSVTEGDGCRVTLTIEVHATPTKAAHDRAVKKVGKEVSIPGFRKGKVPANMVIKKYGSYIRPEWEQLLVHTALKEALPLASLHPESQISKPNFSKCSLEEGAEFTVEFESAPQVPAIDYPALSVEKTEAQPVTDEDVQARIDDWVAAKTRPVDVTDRAVQEGDIVKLTIDNADDDANLYTDHPFEVAEGKMGLWMRNLITGMNIGDTAEAVSELDENATDEVKENFQPTNCRITVTAIQTPEKPELDEQFFEGQGVASLEELQNKARESIVEERENEATAAYHLAIEDAILERYPFDIPATMAEQERQARIKKRIQELQEHGASEEEILGKEKEIEVEVADEVEKAIRMHYIRQNIISEQNIEVSQSEMQEGMAPYMTIFSQMQMFDSQGESNEFLKNISSSIHYSIVVQKVRKHMVEQLTQQPEKSLTE